MLGVALLERCGTELRRARRREALARLPAARPDLHRRARRDAEPAARRPAARDRDAAQPVPRVDRRAAPRRRVRLGRRRRPGARGADGVGGRAPQPHGERRLRGDVHGRRARGLARRETSSAAASTPASRSSRRDSRLAEALRTARELARSSTGRRSSTSSTRATATTTGCTRSTTRRSSPRRSTRSTATSRPGSAAVVQGGWDTDTNGAAVGSILGALGPPDRRALDGAAARPHRELAARLRRERDRRARPADARGRLPPSSVTSGRSAARPARPAADRPADGRAARPGRRPRALDGAKILAAPDDPADWPAWREALRRWRDEARARIALRRRRVRRPGLAWTQSCFSVALVWLWDELLYDHDARPLHARAAARRRRARSAASTASCSGTPTR